MSVAHSRLTSQGQVSVPAPIRRKLGVGPGAILEWSEDKDGRIVVRRSGRFTFAEMHEALFPDGTPVAHDLAELREGIRDQARKRHARR
jgi:AbrB family looped-hinge helix DNA binding protein